jgi:hypothetical protein
MVTEPACNRTQAQSAADYEACIAERETEYGQAGSVGWIRACHASDVDRSCPGLGREVIVRRWSGVIAGLINAHYIDAAYPSTHASYS